MPLTQISVRKDKSPEERSAIVEGIYQAMRRSFAVPDDDKFMTISEFDDANFVYGRRYPDVSRSDDLVIIQVTVSNNRSQDQKLALYGAIVEELAERAGVQSEDVFISIVEALPENWSFGGGRAQNIGR